MTQSIVYMCAKLKILHVILLFDCLFQDGLFLSIAARVSGLQSFANFLQHTKLLILQLKGTWQVILRYVLSI